MQRKVSQSATSLRYELFQSVIALAQPQFVSSLPQSPHHHSKQLWISVFRQNTPDEVDESCRLTQTGLIPCWYREPKFLQFQAEIESMEDIFMLRLAVIAMVRSEDFSTQQILLRGKGIFCRSPYPIFYFTCGNLSFRYKVLLKKYTVLEI